MSKQKPENKKKAGGQSKFTQELFDVICNQIATTSNGLRKICKDNGISAESFYLWIKADKELLNTYTRAREDQADFLIEDMLEIADNRERDDTPFTGANHVQRARLQVETRKFIAAKLKPKKYGDKVDVDLSSNGEPLKININFPNPNGD